MATDQDQDQRVQGNSMMEGSVIDSVHGRKDEQEEVIYDIVHPFGIRLLIKRKQ